MLTSLTDWTAVVVGPSIDQATIRSVQIVDLASHIAMVVAVLSNGVIEKRTVEVATELTPEIVEDASRRLVQAVEGKTLAELEQAAPDDRPDPLLDAAITALSAAGRQAELYVGGASRLAGAFDAAAQLQEVLALLEEQIVVVSLMRTDFTSMRSGEMPVVRSRFMVPGMPMPRRWDWSRCSRSA